MEMREGKVKCLSAAGFHHMAYVEWGDAANPRVLVCVHGLTRCSRDFDFLAQALAADKVDVAVLHCPTIKPLDEAGIVAAAARTLECPSDGLGAASV